MDKVQISDCSEMLKLDPTSRKRLVAAVLRLSDELDIDSHRVNLEVVQNYSLDPHNSVYWWLHERANVFIISDNVIRIQIWLSPNDVKQFGRVVHTAFIDEFREKNRPVLDVLVENNIPMVVSLDSEVIELDRADPLPLEIATVLGQMQEKTELPIELEPVEEHGEDEGFLDWAIKMLETGEALTDLMKKIGELAENWTEKVGTATGHLDNVQGDVRRVNVIVLQVAEATNSFADAVNEASGKMRDNWNTFFESFHPFVSLESSDVRRFVGSSGATSEYLEEMKKIETIAGSVHSQINDLSSVVESSRLQSLRLHGVNKSLNKAVRRVDLALRHFSETLDEIMNSLLEIARLAKVSPSLMEDTEM